MTSSLVGSEMCIRDRQQHGQPVFRAQERHAPGAALGVTMGPVASSRSSHTEFISRHCHCSAIGGMPSASRTSRIWRR
eukprot:865144-Prorocentrum_lima.AAC.1